MFLKVLVAIVAIHRINFVNTYNPNKPTISEEAQIHRYYAHLIKEEPVILTGDTAFCKTEDKNLWINACREVWKQLQAIKQYDNMYLDYSDFSTIRGELKCQKKTVDIAKYAEIIYKNLIVTDTPTRLTITQHMPICYGRFAKITKDISTKFHKSSDRYTPYKLYKDLNISYDNKDRNDFLLTHSQPVSNKTKLTYKLLQYLPILEHDESNSNIVHWSNEYLFVRLCLLALHSYKDADLNTTTFCMNKPKAITKMVYIEKPTKMKPNVHSFVARIYPCNEYITEITPTNPTPELLSKLNNSYALMKGIQNDSVIVLAHEINRNDNSLILRPVELIRNVYKEFLEDIYLPKHSFPECYRESSSTQEESNSNPFLE